MSCAIFIFFHQFVFRFIPKTWFLYSSRLASGRRFSSDGVQSLPGCNNVGGCSLVRARRLTVRADVCVRLFISLTCVTIFFSYGRVWLGWVFSSNSHCICYQLFHISYQPIKIMHYPQLLVLYIELLSTCSFSSLSYRRLDRLLKAINS